MWGNGSLFIVQFGITNDSANESLDTKCPAIPPTPLSTLRALLRLLTRVEASMPPMQTSKRTTLTSRTESEPTVIAAKHAICRILDRHGGRSGSHANGPIHMCCAFVKSPQMSSAHLFLPLFCSLEVLHSKPGRFGTHGCGHRVGRRGVAAIKNPSDRPYHRVDTPPRTLRHRTPNMLPHCVRHRNTSL